MAFGFGFNKQKVLSAAEKYVQQGKMQNAIAEYEKVTKADPKDLTVTNTVGDLYSRLGDADKATECFKTVGDAYAAQGFTVKAIAMYKKISKLKPSLESVLKLAELYTQQGLFNDARAQYLQVAEEFLKSGELDNAVRIFQKILEMDPDNTAMRIKLAEVYVRLGKKNEAWQIFSSTAETLRSKGSLSGAEEVLQRMLTLDPGSSYALLMQGRNLLEAGDAEAAIGCLEKVSDLDSNPDGLRDLLKAYLKTGRLSDAGTLASKLLAVHNDLAAISAFADALMQAGQYENALQVYDQHADRLLAEDSEKVLKNLHSIIGHVRDNPASLEKLLELFQKAGESTHVTEVIELLAHASVQSGDLPRARDLYQKLASVEPGNPLHMNHYQQVVSQLGGPVAEKLISAEEAAVIVDELEATSPSIHQHYSDAVALAVRSALTDAELFISYNMPAKALGPLMGALPQAPQDLRLNQRLAALHTRAGRFTEAGVCCRTLQSVYSEAGYPEEATRYGELADRYEQRSATNVSAGAGVESASVETAGSETDIEESSFGEAAFDGASAEPAAEEISPEVAASPWPVAEVPSAGEDSEFSVVGEHGVAESGEPAEISFGGMAPPSETHSAPGAEAEEIDLSSEWDDAITIEADDLPPVAEVSGDGPAEAAEAGSSAEDKDSEKIAETIEEIRFYLEHGMPEQAATAFEKLQASTSDEATINTLRAELEGAAQPAPAADEVTPVDSVSEFAIDETPAIAEEVSPSEIGASDEPVVVEDHLPEFAAPMAAEPQTALTEPKFAEAVAIEAAPVETAAHEPAHEPAVETAPTVLQEVVSDLDASLGDSFLPEPISHEVEPPMQYAVEHDSSASPEPEPGPRLELEPVGNATPTSFAGPRSEIIGEFVADLEASLGDDFLKDAPLPQSAPALQTPSTPKIAPAVAASPTPQPPSHKPAQQWPTPAPAVVPAVAAPVPAAASAAAASSHSAYPTPLSQASSLQSPSLQASTPVAASSAAAMAPQIPPPSALPAVKASPFTQDTGVDLAEMFGELKQDLEAGSTTTEEDPETHYNLGIAFREMGLLDEAIGELQKTCQSVDRGHPFPQVMQAYTWLAQCFLDKGVPEASIRWYQKALAVPGIDEETRTALHYELAAAYEAAGDRHSALKHFMEVYGRNIDYRDVAERIKPLRS